MSSTVSSGWEVKFFGVDVKIISATLQETPSELETCIGQKLLNVGQNQGFIKIKAEPVEWKAMAKMIVQDKQDQQQQTDSIFALSYLCEQGFGGVVQDEQTAKMLLKLAAKRGHIEAQLKLAQKDPSQALHWLTAVAATGIIKGQRALADYYVEHKEPELAIQFYERIGDGEALWAIASIYLDEEPKNYAKAFPYLKTCFFEHQMQQATKSLAHCYWFGIGTQKDTVFFLLVTGSALQNRDGTSYEALCNMFVTDSTDSNGNVIKKNCDHLFAYAKKAMSEGSARGCTRVGICYMKGIGTAVDHKKAADCFKVGAEKGDSWAQTYLGSYYLDGIGDIFVKDSKKAFELYSKAAKKDSDAMYSLGHCYLTGTGVEKDVGEAIVHLRKAEKAGNARAKKLLETRLSET